MPKSKMCQTQAKMDARRDAIIVSRIMALGMSANQIAAECDCSDDTVRSWYKNPGKISVITIRKINRLLRKKNTDLFIPLEVFE